MHYALGPRAVIARARALALWGAVRSAAPAFLVLALVGEMKIAPSRWLTMAGMALAVLAIARGLAELRTATARLSALDVFTDDDGITVRTARGETRIASDAIDRAVDIGGPLGGLRLVLADRPDLPSRVDVPRGGDHFGELRERIGAWRSVERARRRGKIARFAVAASIVAGVFFVPFVIDDARGSRPAIVAVLALAWTAMRLTLGR